MPSERPIVSERQKGLVTLLFVLVLLAYAALVAVDVVSGSRSATGFALVPCIALMTHLRVRGVESGKAFLSGLALMVLSFVVYGLLMGWFTGRR